MGNKIYMTPEMEIIEFETEDTITTSDDITSRIGEPDEGNIY